jgi:hypothetical protein
VGSIEPGTDWKIRSSDYAGSVRADLVPRVQDETNPNISMVVAERGLLNNSGNKFCEREASRRYAISGTIFRDPSDMSCLERTGGLLPPIP